jgi:hypothetical protein
VQGGLNFQRIPKESALRSEILAGRALLQQMCDTRASAAIGGCGHSSCILRPCCVWDTTISVRDVKQGPAGGPMARKNALRRQHHQIPLLNGVQQHSTNFLSLKCERRKKPRKMRKGGPLSGHPSFGTPRCPSLSRLNWMKSRNTIPTDQRKPSEA